MAGLKPQDELTLPTGTHTPNLASGDVRAGPKGIDTEDYSIVNEKRLVRRPLPGSSQSRV